MQDWLQEHERDITLHPQSPDHNPIEYLWDQVHRANLAPRNLTKMGSTTHQTLCQIPRIAIKHAILKAKCDTTITDGTITITCPANVYSLRWARTPEDTIKTNLHTSIRFPRPIFSFSLLPCSYILL